MILCLILLVLAALLLWCIFKNHYDSFTPVACPVDANGNYNGAGIQINWDAPSNNGGDANCCGYQITVTDETGNTVGSTKLLPEPADTTWTWPGPVDWQTQYTASVIAINSAGSSPAATGTLITGLGVLNISSITVLGQDSYGNIHPLQAGDLFYSPNIPTPLIWVMVAVSNMQANINITMSLTTDDKQPNGSNYNSYYTFVTAPTGLSNPVSLTNPQNAAPWVNNSLNPPGNIPSQQYNYYFPIYYAAGALPSTVTVSQGDTLNVVLGCTGATGTTTCAPSGPNIGPSGLFTYTVPAPSAVTSTSPHLYMILY